MIYVAMITRFAVPLIALALAVTRLPAQEADSAAPRVPKSSSSLITIIDIDRVRASVANAYDAVQLLRPRWLRAQRDIMQLPGTGSSLRMQVMHVYMDDHEMGGLDFLRSVPAGQVYTLRYLSTSEVGARYGPSSGPGIVVTLRR